MPFNFLGRMTEDDRDALTSWLDKNTSKVFNIQNFYQKRAAMLRRSSGLLNEVMKERGLSPSFKKEAYQEPSGGIRLVPDRDDRESAILVSNIKDNVRDMLQADDEAVFQMNNICVLIEKAEDEAFYCESAKETINENMDNLVKLFSDPNYRDILISNSDQYQGDPRYRIDSLEPRTAFEKELIPSMRAE